MNNNNSNFTNSEARLIDRLGCAGIILIFILSIAVTIFSPVIAFGISYFIGWIMSLCIGDVVANGLNMIFALIDLHQRLFRYSMELWD